MQTSPLRQEKSGEETSSLLPIFPEGGGTSVHRLHLTENFENTGWKVNIKVTFRKFQPKIEEYILRWSVHSDWYEPETHKGLKRV